MYFQCMMPGVFTPKHSPTAPSVFFHVRLDASLDEMTDAIKAAALKAVSAQRLSAEDIGGTGT